jgi:hypothetical protein
MATYERRERTHTGTSFTDLEELSLLYLRYGELELCRLLYLNLDNLF